MQKCKMQNANYQIHTMFVCVPYAMLCCLDMLMLRYAEFVDGFDPLAWDFAPDRVNYYEL